MTGTTLRTKELDEKFCADCGSAIKIKAEICPSCGVRQIALTPSSGKDKTTTALLAFFLGGFGAHKFYLGETGKGFLYLFFCWTLIPSILSFIAFIQFLSMTNESFNAKYK